ncbi:MAG: hypothetical protein JW973_17930 [Bacteroidales bacterium]|nr:hypothetical protein [Bacteroidales bacterium]
MKHQRFYFIREITTILVVFLFLNPLIQAQFPAFPPEDATSVIDRDQMMWQLGITFPDLPSKQADNHRPVYA